MKLHENIQRIHQMMGLISEDKKADFAKKMIDTLGGLREAMKYYGGFQNLKKYLNLAYDRKSDKWVPASTLETKPVDLSGILTREDKINFIKDMMETELHQLSYGDSNWDENEYSVLESTETYEKVAFTYYYDELDVTTFYKDKNGEFTSQNEMNDYSETIKYEDLPDDMLDKAFEFIANKVQL